MTFFLESSKARRRRPAAVVPEADGPSGGDLREDVFAPPSEPEPPALDAAWAEAEAALPTDSHVHTLRLMRLPTHRDTFWQAVAGAQGRYSVSGEGPTPAAALHSLAAHLATPPTPASAEEERHG